MTDTDLETSRVDTDIRATWAILRGTDDVHTFTVCQARIDRLLDRRLAITRSVPSTT